jgi:hypothetical protein
MGEYGSSTQGWEWRYYSGPGGPYAGDHIKTVKCEWNS